jgi:hypothetical protein
MRKARQPATARQVCVVGSVGQLGIGFPSLPLTFRASTTTTPHYTTTLWCQEPEACPCLSSFRVRSPPAGVVSCVREVARTTRWRWAHRVCVCVRAYRLLPHDRDGSLVACSRLFTRVVGTPVTSPKSTQQTSAVSLAVALF